MKIHGRRLGKTTKKNHFSSPLQRMFWAWFAVLGHNCEILTESYKMGVTVFTTTVRVKLPCALRQGSLGFPPLFWPLLLVVLLNRLCLFFA